MHTSALGPSLRAVSVPVLPLLGVVRLWDGCLDQSSTRTSTGPCGDLTFIAGASGQPLTKESFGNLFRDA